MGDLDMGNRAIGFVKYSGKVLRTAFSPAWVATGTIATIIAIIGPPIGKYLLVPEGTMNGLFWEVPLGFMAVIFLIRIFVAPYILHEDDIKRANREFARAESEMARANSESARAKAEAERATAEHDRASSEGNRADNEAERANREAKRADDLQSKIAHDNTLNELYARILGIRNIWESGHPGGAEKWRAEVAGWVSDVEECLRVQYSPQEAYAFRNIPVPPAEFPDSDPPQAQRARLLDARIAFVSEFIGR